MSTPNICKYSNFVQPIHLFTDTTSSLTRINICKLIPLTLCFLYQHWINSFLSTRAVSTVLFLLFIIINAESRIVRLMIRYTVLVISEYIDICFMTMIMDSNTLNVIDKTADFIVVTLGWDNYSNAST